MKVNELRDDELVRLYIGIRDRRAMRKAGYSNEDADDKARQDKIEGVMLQRFQAAGVESVRTAFGTAYKSTRSSARVADKDAFMGYVRGNDAWELLETRASKEAVEQYVAENEELPPGINWREEVTVNFNRS